MRIVIYFTRASSNATVYKRRDGGRRDYSTTVCPHNSPRLSAPLSILFYAFDFKPNIVLDM